MPTTQSKHKESRFGFIAILVWCIVSGAAYVLTGAMETSIEPTFLCFGVFLIAALFFLIYNSKNLVALYQKVKVNLKTTIFVNITTFLCWYWTIYPLKYMEPAIVVAIILASQPILTLISGFIIGYKKQISQREFIFSALLFIGIFFLAMIVLERKSAINHFSSLRMLIAFLACLGSGIALAINNIHTKKLSRNGFAPIDILSVRFIFMVIFTFLLVKHELQTSLHSDIWLKVLIISASLIIIPQTVFQYALRELEPLTISMVAPLKPVLVFLFEFCNKELAPTFWSILGICYLTFVSLIGSLEQYKKSRAIA